VTGKLSSGTSSLLKVIQEQIEPNIIAHGQNQGPRPPGWKRPFLETASAKREPISKTIKDTVEFPEKDESMGELIMTFMGPPLRNFLELKVFGTCMQFPSTIIKISPTGLRHPWYLYDLVACRSFEQRVHRNRVASLVCPIHYGFVEVA
jgi:hypothetical protein